MVLSNVGIGGLGVRCVLMFEYAAGEIEGIGVVDAFVVRQELLNLTLVMRFFGGIFILFFEVVLLELRS